MKTKSVSTRLTASRRYGKVAAVVALSVVLLGGTYTQYVKADEFDAQIQALRNQNAAAQQNVDVLQGQAASYQDAIARLQAQINAIQVQIVANQAEQARLQTEITTKQAQLDKQRELLGEDVKAMYVDGQISTIEMLATSKNISEFVDKEEYRNAVQQNLQESLAKIAALQNELKQKKDQVDQLLESIKAQQAQIAADQAQQAQMLAYTQAQKNEYDQQIASNSSRISELKKQQAIENARRFGTSAGMVGGGGYPWGNAPCVHTGQVTGYCANYDWGVNGSVWNPATGGYGYRNCTDWVAWRAGGVPAGLGNANTWATRGGAMGYRVSTAPRVGDAAVVEAGYYGHVMYVEAVSENGITVSDYNRLGDGLYRMTNLTRVGDGAYQSSGGGTSYIKFVSF
ncbi:MAG TPA: CHAP domain-containing protein [Candidatus Limnocylindrales bacterium]|nr:CHAP domain-containing protein [Candidatus Limnocylindrales bacterium]